MLDADSSVEAQGGFICDAQFVKSNSHWAVEMDGDCGFERFDPGTRIVLPSTFGWTSDRNPTEPKDIEIVADGVWTLQEVILNGMLAYLESVSVPQFYTVRGLRRIDAGCFSLILEGDYSGTKK